MFVNNYYIDNVWVYYVYYSDRNIYVMFDCTHPADLSLNCSFSTDKSIDCSWADDIGKDCVIPVSREV